MRAAIYLAGFTAALLLSGPSTGANADETTIYKGQITSKAGKGCTRAIARDVEVSVAGNNVAFRVIKAAGEVNGGDDPEDDVAESGGTNATLNGQSFNVTKSKNRYKGELHDGGIDFEMDKGRCVYTGRLKPGA